MKRPHLERVRIQNYGCIKDVTLQLTPLHALIGPNDSGKSTALTALRTITTLAAGSIGNADDNARLVAFLRSNPQFAIEGWAEDQGWRLSWHGPPGGALLEQLMSRGGGRQSGQMNINYGSQWARHQAAPQMQALGGSILLRLEPDELRKSTPLIAEGQPLRLQNALGFGLPAVYDAIVTRDLPAYMEISAKLSTLFPTVKSISLKNPSQASKALGVTLTNGAQIPAEFMSEGMLYYLAYAALPHLEPAAIILIEEPENGLHPARIREVMDVLRKISETTQVILATHSPLVINELQPEEVSVLRRTPEEGTTATLIKDTPNFAERSRVYALGELWVSYADGNIEAPLFTKPQEPPDPGEPVNWSESKKQ